MKKTSKKDVVTRRQLLQIEKDQYGTSYGQMNQWVNTDASLPGNAMELARDGGLGSVYRVVPLPPPEEQRRQELSSRERLLYGIMEGRDTTSKMTRASSRFSTPRTVIAPLKTGSYLGDQGDIRSTTPMTEIFKRKYGDPYGDPVPAPVHMQYSPAVSGGYDDYHKSFMEHQRQEESQEGPPRLRNGRHGGSWRHVREVLQAKGARTVFVDGIQRIDDSGRVEQGNMARNQLLQRVVRCAGKPTLSNPGPFTPRHSLTAYAAPRAERVTEGVNWLVMR